ncbi:MAG: DUF488 domain-containing protein [Pirellulaceae bacterium]
MNTDSKNVLYTIGHSNHDQDRFIALLRQHGIEVLADVRSAPWSKYTPHFNRAVLEAALPPEGIRYLFLGDSLGGRPNGNDLYDEAGHVLYNRVALTELFRGGIDRLKKGIQTLRVAIMCSEEDPTVCHRFLLVTRVMADEGIEVRHIRGDGSVESETAVRSISGDRRNQGVLFQEMEHDTWKSLRSVLPKAQQPDFSGD